MRILFSAVLLAGFSFAQTPDALVEKIQREVVAAVPSPESKPDASVPHGEILRGVITDSKIYPGTQNTFEVYVPAEYSPSRPACLLVRLDGLREFEATVLDNLIAKKDVPVMIGVGIDAGVIWGVPGGPPNRPAVRFNRSYEFDSVNARFSEFVLNELLPVVQKMTTTDGRAIHISMDGNDHAVTGGSTGGIGSFTLAWQRPDQFTRVYALIGTFVAMRGGNEYPALIRKTEPRPIRIFLEDGSADAWNPLFGSWWDANLNMESALQFAGYDVAHAWGTHGHDDDPGKAIFPDVMRWLWRDYPAPDRGGESRNSTLKEILQPEEGWTIAPRTFVHAGGLAADAAGQVVISDSGTIFRFGDDGTAVEFAKAGTSITGEVFGPDGTLYAVEPSERRVVAVHPGGAPQTVVDGIAGRGITVTRDGAIFVSEPGEHPDLPSRVWKVSGGTKTLADEGIESASGVAFSADGLLFFAAERTTKWIYSYLVQLDGSFIHKQPFYWLHMTDVPNNSGAEDLAVDRNGNLYVATRMGIQVCDPNGRVRAILPLPSPSGPVRSICFGGPRFDTLWATDGVQVFMRRLKVIGVPPWAPRVTVESQGAG